MLSWPVFCCSTAYLDYSPNNLRSTPPETTPSSAVATSPPQTVTTPSSIASDDSPMPDYKSRPGGLTDSPNARSKSVTVAEGQETYGVSPFFPLDFVTHPPSRVISHFLQVLNRHPAAKDASPSSEGSTFKSTFRVGVSEDRNKRCRRTMEDAHSFVYDYAGIRGQGYFAVFE